MKKNKKQPVQEETLDEKQQRLLKAIVDICEEFEWIVSVNYKDNDNETMTGIIIGEEPFVANAEVLIFEHDEVSNFGFEETEEGTQLVELDKDKMKGQGNLH